MWQRNIGFSQQKAFYSYRYISSFEKYKEKLPKIQDL